MEIKFYDWEFSDLRSPGVEAVYITDANPPEFSPACGISWDATPEARRAREMEAKGYAENPGLFEFKEKVIYLPTRADEVDPDTVRSLRLVIEREAPDWVARVWAVRAFEEIEGGKRTSDEDLSVITLIPLQAVVAASRVLMEFRR